MEEADEHAGFITTSGGYDCQSRVGATPTPSLGQTLMEAPEPLSGRIPFKGLKCSHTEWMFVLHLLLLFHVSLSELTSS